jgi:translation elongation factor EF-4
VVGGQVAKGDTVVMMNTGKKYTLGDNSVLEPVKHQ